LLQQLRVSIWAAKPVNRGTPAATTFCDYSALGVIPLSQFGPVSQCLLVHIALIVPTRDCLGLVIQPPNIMGEGFRQRFKTPSIFGRRARETLDRYQFHPKGFRPLKRRDQEVERMAKFGLIAGSTCSVGPSQRDLGDEKTPQKGGGGGSLGFAYKPFPNNMIGQLRKGASRNPTDGVMI